MPSDYFHYSSWNNPFVKSTVELMLRPGDIEAAKAQQIAQAQAQAVQQSAQSQANANVASGQAWGHALEHVGLDTAALLNQSYGPEAQTRKLEQQHLQAQTADIQAQQREREQQAQQRQGQMEAQHALAKAYTEALDPQTGSVDRNKLTQNLSGLGLGDHVPAILKTLDEADEANAKAKEARTKADESELGYAKFLGGQMQAAEFNPSIVNGLFAVAASHGHDVSQFQQLWEQNPEAFKSAVTKLVSPPKPDFTLGDTRYTGDGKPIVTNDKPPTPKMAQPDSFMLDGKPVKGSSLAGPDGVRYIYNGQDVTGRATPMQSQAAVTINQTGEDAKAIADAIIAGDQPPDVKGLFRMAGPVRAELAKQKYDMTTANLDWQATQKHVQTLNGQQQTRFRQAIDTALHSVDVIDDLADKWKGGNFPILNKANLALAKQGAYGPNAASIANQLEAQISDVTSEIGQVYMGGNSPTDHALELAGKNLKADWSDKVLHDMTQLARTNLTIRRNSVLNVGVAGASQSNPYGQQQTPAAQTPQSGSVVMRAPNGVPYQVPADKVDAAKAQGWK